MKAEETSIEPQSIKAFLKENVAPVQETKEVHLKRFNEPFVIKALSATELNQLQENATTKKRNRRNGTTTSELNQEMFSQSMIIDSVVTPKLTSVELQKAYGTTGSAIKTLYAMLTAGEYTKLSEAIINFNGLGDDDDSLDNLTDQAKK